MSAITRPYGTGPLSNVQKGKLCILARKAFDRIGGDSTTGMEFAEWRKQEQWNAVGKQSLRDCMQREYLRLVAHYEDLIGESGRAVTTHMRAGTEPRRIAEHKLLEALKKAGLEIAYADTICRSKFKCHVEDASTAQLWKLYYDIRQRGASKRKAKPVGGGR